MTHTWSGMILILSHSAAQKASAAYCETNYLFLKGLAKIILPIVGQIMDA